MTGRPARRIIPKNKTKKVKKTKPVIKNKKPAEPKTRNVNIERIEAIRKNRKYSKATKIKRIEFFTKVHLAEKQKIVDILKELKNKTPIRTITENHPYFDIIEYKINPRKYRIELSRKEKKLEADARFGMAVLKKLNS